VVAFYFEVTQAHAKLLDLNNKDALTTLEILQLFPSTRMAIPIAKGLRMYPTYQFSHTYGYRAQRFRCPLLFPHVTGETCDHVQFGKGNGCVKDLGLGTRWVNARHLGPRRLLYHAIYDQRTSTERINRQSKEWGIKRPKVRNIDSVRNFNRLPYLVINARALRRARNSNASLLTMPVRLVA